MPFNNFAILAVVIWVGLGPHKYHASLTEIDYNPESGKLEILLRLFSEDLQHALGGKQGKTISMDEGSNGERKVFAYLQRRFAVGSSAAAVPATLEWVGMEFEVDICWVFLEASLKPGPVLVAKNTLFFELYDDQINTVTLKGKGGSRAAIFKSGDGPKKIPWKDPNSAP